MVTEIRILSVKKRILVCRDVYSIYLLTLLALLAILVADWLKQLAQHVVFSYMADLFQR